MELPIYLSSSPPLIGGCLKSGVFFVSKSLKSFKNLETYIIIKKSSSVFIL